MNAFVFAVYDAAAEAFLTPFFFDTKGQAIRSFSDACNTADHQFSRHGADYTLFHLGMYDSSKGMMLPLSTPDSMGGALSFVDRARPDIEVAS